jgi:hypothetical protein
MHTIRVGGGARSTMIVIVIVIAVSVIAVSASSSGAVMTARWHRAAGPG